MIMGLIIYILAVSVPAAAQTVPPPPSIIDTTAAADTTTAVPGDTRATAPIAFDGGVLIGDVSESATTGVGEYTIIISGAAGFLLQEGNPGGVLTLKFAQPPAESVNATFHQFPLELDPSAVVLDGKPLEIQIAPRQVYLFMQLAADDNGELLLSQVIFRPGVELSDTAVCGGCAQIRLAKTHTPDPKDLAEFIKRK
jgi:hypothetical protein